jgi:hypothetical protein
LNGVHGVITKKIEFFIIAAVRTSDPTGCGGREIDEKIRMSFALRSTSWHAGAPSIKVTVLYTVTPDSSVDIDLVFRIGRSQENA